MSVIDVIMRLTDQVTAPLTRIRSQMDATAKTSTRLGRTVQTVGKNIGSISSALMPVSAGLVAAGTMAATTFMDFDRVITGAGAKAGASAAELEKMRAAATQMGADFPVSATEVAQAMDALAASGFNANQTVALMPLSLHRQWPAARDWRRHLRLLPARLISGAWHRKTLGKTQRAWLMLFSRQLTHQVLAYKILVWLCNMLAHRLLH